nr:MAG TPA: hypothetical protein [Caudoviricetes sp.]
MNQKKLVTLVTKIKELVTQEIKCLCGFKCYL